MLPTFVIGLREGLEAALIVGIVAAFLRKQGRRDLVRWVFVGVGSAVAICALAGAALEIYSRNLPQRQQEGLETVIGALAVGMVTYMVVWMRRHSRELKGQLEGLAAEAIAGHSRAGRAMVLMAFLAVIREGLETVVFLIAAFNESGSSSAAGAGAALGITVAAALGYGIYRGGVRINLSKFFRATGLVLVLVAAGLVVNALHTAHEAGWLDAGQGRTVDLSWLVAPGTVQASLLTGMLGIQRHPVTIEVVGWLVYLVPVGLYVAWPPGRAVPTRMLVRAGSAVSVAAGIAALALVGTAPGRPAQRPVPTGTDAQVLARGPESVTLRLALDGGAPRTVQLSADGTDLHSGVPTTRYRASLPGSPITDMPSTVPAGRLAQLNGGRLPLGVVPVGGNVPITYDSTDTVTAWLTDRTDRVLDIRTISAVRATAHAGARAVPLAQPIRQSTSGMPAANVTAAARAAERDATQLDRRADQRAWAAWLGGLAVVAAGLAAAADLARRRAARVLPERPQQTAPSLAERLTSS